MIVKTIKYNLFKFFLNNYILILILTISLKKINTVTSREPTHSFGYAIRISQKKN